MSGFIVKQAFFSEEFVIIDPRMVVQWTRVTKMVKMKCENQKIKCRQRAKVEEEERKRVLCEWSQFPARLKNQALFSCFTAEFAKASSEE